MESYTNNGLSNPNIPTLIPRSYQDSRVINNIDNEELIPATDFHDLLSDWEVEGGLSKVSSETDKTYFDTAGRRMIYSRAGSHNWKTLQGIEDEYIPDLVDFNFRTWIDDKRANEDHILDELHSKVQPISIGKHEGATRPTSRSTGSPEREKDRMILASLPSNYLSLSFSERKRIMNEALPDFLQNDKEYKKHITKLIRRNSVSSATSPAHRLSNSFSLQNSVNSTVTTPDNTNVKGSLVLGKWRLGRIIGRGAYGIIRECSNESDEIKAMKIIDVHGELRHC
ncbi:hypothetical protein KL930_003522 [Ogataea haglerorum]|uniref:Protein kinase domain-containing protein n=1 Tax=Ogataea haglerorum TaxID=1937702 RepID=A0ABQ7RF48_9ASCO|nr:uncharacterized protein KL911_003114 [Ogataea haglerorum]KAG7695524.1 hypothetical protein KL915_002914 [Ogataea haglerorum]KAG7695854.1 hypothetical protein KL951_003379 [Ogataea haglerorum]KAG7705722.1 hypothetical protein KL914_003560 [Ogataea haglerorum]KAG7707260.1 hypothetical protein KL950_002920 [Ogataea haglerorum]KAG7718443.1 hypothetical protein KL913_002438 [Ogataea haglerorum]